MSKDWRVGILFAFVYGIGELAGILILKGHGIAGVAISFPAGIGAGFLLQWVEAR